MSINSDLYYNLKKRLEDAKNRYKYSLWSDVPLSDIEELEEVADKILLALGMELLSREAYEKEIGYEEEVSNDDENCWVEYPED